MQCRSATRPGRSDRQRRGSNYWSRVEAVSLGPGVRRDGGATGGVTCRPSFKNQLLVIPAEAGIQCRSATRPGRSDRQRRGSNYWSRVEAVSLGPGVRRDGGATGGVTCRPSFKNQSYSSSRRKPGSSVEAPRSDRQRRGSNYWSRVEAVSLGPGVRRDDGAGRVRPPPRREGSVRSGARCSRLAARCIRRSGLRGVGVEGLVDLVAQPLLRRQAECAVEDGRQQPGGQRTLAVPQQRRRRSRGPAASRSCRDNPARRRHGTPRDGRRSRRCANPVHSRHEVRR